MIRAFLFLVAITLPMMLIGCVSMVLPLVPTENDGSPARPAIDTSGLVPDEWEAGRAALRRRFEAEVYGDWPGVAPASVSDQRLVEAGAYDGLGRIEEWDLDLGTVQARLVVILPEAAAAPAPVIVMQTFCGTRTALGGRDDLSAPLNPAARECSEVNGWQGHLMTGVFGRHIAEPPIETILARGYALAFLHPGEIVPDNPDDAPAALDALMPGRESGAIIAWAWGYSRAIDALESDPRLDPARMAVWGHSRNAKSALVAAAFDTRIDLVLAHQAGTGGTTLTRSFAGESVAQITGTYPYWFNERYASYGNNEDGIPLDQHELIALMAPRPLLIGGAWRDAWSDPQGSFRAALGANPVYALYGSEGLRQPSLGAFDPEADIAVFMRRGLHGVQPSDWHAFLEFLDAHFHHSQ
ncbi:alpha/beta hydrolase family protein [Maricaulis maris]|uniref:alpha/beta hydrolase family protein n=1 Tax=Maricaulis maris TaxID=74318 RepID=UPI003A957BB3